MRENAVKKKWAADAGAINAWLAIPSAFSAEMMAHQDFDSVTVDMQHGMVDFQAAVAMLQAISTTERTPLARVPWNDPASIMKILDAGAYGVICPMINNAAECARFVGACRYAPAGYRSWGPARGLLYGGSDYAQHANDTILAFAMIETREALASLEQIVAVEQLDAVYIGPNDLSISLGHPPNPDPSASEVVSAMETILSAAKRAGRAVGVHCTGGAMARRMLAKGFDFVTLNNDARLLAGAAGREIALARGGDAQEGA